MLMEIQIPATKPVIWHIKYHSFSYWTETWHYLKCCAFVYRLVFTCWITCQEEKSFNIFIDAQSSLMFAPWKVNLKCEVVTIWGLLTIQVSHMIFRLVLKRDLSSSTDIPGDCNWQQKVEEAHTQVAQRLTELSLMCQQTQIKIYPNVASNNS